MSWKKVKLGEICTIEKGTTGIQKAISGDYPLVVTGEERKSHNEYQFDDEAVIVPLVSGTGHGHASLKRIHFQTGKFALGSILCAVIPKDKKQVSAEYLYRFLDLNKENELVARMRGMANVTLPIKEIAQVEIPLPPLEDQLLFVERYKRLEIQSQTLNNELTHQQTLVKQLRQQLLQDAVQGKLVKNTEGGYETAHDLLKAIKAEKEQLIKDKKLKKEKELPSIKPEEIPFDIPEDWAWCRLGEIALHSEAGKSYQAEEISAGVNQLGVIKTSAITSGVFLENKNKLLPNQNVSIEKILIEKDDIIFCRASGSKGLAGKSCLVEDTPKAKLILSDKSIRYVFSKNVSKKYIQLYNSTIFSETYYNQLGTGKSTSMNNINREQFNNLPIPFPPLSTQHQIVAKVESLMQLCDSLEASIAASTRENEALLQQVLREALQG